MQQVVLGNFSARHGLLTRMNEQVDACRESAGVIARMCTLILGYS
jgi:hypothetical protein